MGAIEKYVVNQGSRAVDTVQSFGDKFKSVLNRVQGYAGSAFEVAKNGETFVGLEYDKEASIRAAIRDYVKNIQVELARLNTDASTSNALKGDSAVAANKYVDAVSKVAQAYATSLLAYSDKMHEYVEQYRTSDTQLASNVTDEASALASSAETYTEKY